MSIDLGFPKPEEINNQEDYDKAIDGILRLAGALCDLAFDYGLVLTIETKPRTPLAMGNYDLRFQLSASHQMYRGD